MMFVSDVVSSLCECRKRAMPLIHLPALAAEKIAASFCADASTEDDQWAGGKDSSEQNVCRFPHANRFPTSFGAVIHDHVHPAYTQGWANHL